MKHLKVAIIGTGFGVRTQLPAFRLAGGWEVVSLTGSNAAKTRALADANRVPHALTRIEDAVSAGDPDLVCISTPPLFHRDMGLAVLAAGRHCLLEKPMAMNAGEAAELVAAAKGAGKLALVDHELRALPNRQSARRRIAAGDLGEPLLARVSFTSHARARAGLTWDWWASAAHGGGTLGAIGSHVVDMLRWWLGEIGSVAGRLTTSIPELPADGGAARKVGADDGCDLWLSFRNGAVASATLTTVAHAYRGLTWELHGRQGSLWVEEDGKLYVAKRGDPARNDVSVEDGLGSDPIIDGTQWARGSVLLARDLARSIHGNEPLPYAATFEDGLATQRALDAARASTPMSGSPARATTA